MIGRGRYAALAALIAALVVALAIVVTAGGDERTVRAAFASAINVVPGNEVRVAGRKVGEVASIEEVDGDAVVALRIEDDAAWPLPRGTGARIRYGTTAGYAARFVELHLGPASAPPTPEGGALRRSDTVTPVEFDQVFNTFDSATREDLRGLVSNLADTVDDRGRAISRSLQLAPAGLDQSAAILRELGADERALRTLVVAGDRTTRALAARDGELRELVSGAAATFDELAEHGRAQRASLDRFPTALGTGRTTLARLDTSIDGLQALVDDLRPGARELKRMSGPTRRAVRALRDVAPLATDALRTGRRAAPDIGRLASEGSTFLPELARVVDELAPVVACIRPYGPEVAGFVATWPGFQMYFDRSGHVARGKRVRLPFLPGTTLRSEQIVDATGKGIKYAMPRPPGLNVGQPWLLPECGAGADALDASKDPEASR